MTETPFALAGFDLDAFVQATLAEDLGESGDITSAAVIPAEASGIPAGAEVDVLFLSDLTG